MKNLNFQTFIETYPHEFHEFIDSEKVLLAKIDPEYKKILSDISMIKQHNSKIEKLYECEVLELSKEDCKDLQRIIDLQYQALVKEEIAIFLMGCREMMLYKEKFDKMIEQDNR